MVGLLTQAMYRTRDASQIRLDVVKETMERQLRPKPTL